MKKILLVTLALILVICGASVTACGKKGIGIGDNTIRIPDSEGVFIPVRRSRSSGGG
jgi:hypothetical protein